MANEVEPGDIIQYEMNGSEGKPPYGSGIVDRLEDDELHLIAWKRPGDQNWQYGLKGTLYTPDAWWPHPDPDPVLADFAAWRLTHGE